MTLASGLRSVLIGFIAARTTSGWPLVVPPSRPPALLLGRVKPCVGPAAARFHESLLPQLATEGRTAYRAAYRERLHRAAVALSIVGVLGARFCVRSWLLELACALGFVLLELLPSLDPFGLSSQLVWGSSRVEHAVDTYERLVFNQYWDLGELLPRCAIASSALYVLRRLVLSRLRRGKHKPEAREQGGGADLAQVVIKGE